MCVVADSEPMETVNPTNTTTSLLDSVKTMHPQTASLERVITSRMVSTQLMTVAPHTTDVLVEPRSTSQAVLLDSTSMSTADPVGLMYPTIANIQLVK